MTTRKAIWISYDFGLKGDFTGLFTWLDNHSAVECGNGLAFFRHDISKLEGTDSESLIKLLTADIKETVKLSKTDRVYIIFKDTSTNKVKGEFINGNRKQSPWEGYGKLKGGNTIDSEE
ncbi:MAG: hypothetical protein D4R64_06190 [Porphyromonadaceae bacterium]|nr:MAG: hypothetical protein D4R64_06190 [Porphyromonadaceae bacterium]